MTIFDVAIDGLTGSPAELDRYRGQVDLVVNEASPGGPIPQDDGRFVAVIEKLAPR